MTMAAGPVKRVFNQAIKLHMERSTYDETQVSLGSGVWEEWGVGGGSPLFRMGDSQGII